MTTDLTKFDRVRAEIAEYKVKNASLVFDYQDPQGNKDARSHIYKLRKTKSLITDIHKEVKAEALAACQAIDKEKRTLIGDIDEMIEVHDAPLRAIAEKAEQERLAKVRAEEEARQAEEKRRHEELAKREAELCRKEAEVKAQQAEIERVEREKRIAEEAAAKARAETEAKAKAKEAAEKAEKEQLAAIERKRTENEAHRKAVEREIFEYFSSRYDGVSVANGIVKDMKVGKIPHVTINY